MAKITECRCIKQTDKAILVESEYGETAWIPNSQVDDDSEVYQEGDEGTLVISDWFNDHQIDWRD